MPYFLNRVFCHTVLQENNEIGFSTVCFIKPYRDPVYKYTGSRFYEMYDILSKNMICQKFTKKLHQEKFISILRGTVEKF